jgi:hypothetical protein
MSPELIGLPWPLLGLGLAISLVLSALGFKRVEYFVSLGSAASIAAQAVVMPLLGQPKSPRINSIPVWGLQLVAALASVAGVVSRGSRRSAAMLRWMIYSGTHDAIAPACGALRLRDEYCAKRDALPHQVVPA